MTRIGAHVAQQDPVAEARARETDLVQFFLGDPQGYQGPKVRYAVDLRSSTHGAGSFTRTFAHYEAMPEDVARTIEPRDHH